MDKTHVQPKLPENPKFLRDSGYSSSADQLFKERAAMVDVLNAGREWLSAATPENRRSLILAFKRAGVAA